MDEQQRGVELEKQILSATAHLAEPENRWLVKITVNQRPKNEAKIERMEQLVIIILKESS